MNASLAAKSSWNALAGICNLFGRLIAQITIARMLGADGLGKIAYIVWLIEIGNLLVNLGLPSSLTRYLAELHGQKQTELAAQMAKWVFLRYLALALIGAIAVAVMFRFSHQFSGQHKFLPILGLLFLTRGFEMINKAELSGRQRFDLLARINMAAAIILISSVALGSYLFDVAGALVGYTIGALLPAVYGFRMLKTSPVHLPIPATLRKRFWKFTFHIWLALLISAIVWSRSEIFFLERYWEAHEIAMFTVGLTFAMMIKQASEIFSRVFLAHFSGLVGSNEHALIQRQYGMATGLMAVLVIPVAFGGAAIMPGLLPFIFGTEFAPAVPTAMVLTATAALAFAPIGSSLIYAKERSDFIVLGGGIGALISILLGFVIISRFGAWGAAWSRLFVQCSMVLLGIWFITCRMHFEFPFRVVGYALLSGIMCGLSAWSVLTLMPIAYLDLLLAVLGGAIVCMIAFKLFHIIDRDKALLLARLAGTLPSWFGLNTLSRMLEWLSA